MGLKRGGHALTVHKKKGQKDETFVYPLIPLLMAGVSTAALELYFPEETAGIAIEMGPGGISEAMPRILAALGERSADVVQPMVGQAKQASTELLLELTEPAIKDINGKKRAAANARLLCIPADTGQRELEARFIFTAPIGPIEKLGTVLYFFTSLIFFLIASLSSQAQNPLLGQSKEVKHRPSF